MTTVKIHFFVVDFHGSFEIDLPLYRGMLARRDPSSVTGGRWTPSLLSTGFQPAIHRQITAGYS